MKRLTGEQKENIQKLKNKGKGPKEISIKLDIPIGTVRYHYYPEHREQLKVENPERHEFISFIEAIEAGESVTIRSGNYCAKILLYLSEALEFGVKYNYLVEMSERNLQWDLRFMLRKGILRLDIKRYVLTEKGIDLLQYIE